MDDCKKTHYLFKIMCAQFALKMKMKELINKAIRVPEGLESIDERYLPYQKAPVIARNYHRGGVLQLSPMSFSLVPSWSQEEKVKFATHNARIETVTEKPTWKMAFQNQHCLVPMTAFFESVYEGPEAGNMISFERKATLTSTDEETEEDSVLYAAGIFDLWKDPAHQKANLFSFAILTTEPSDYIKEHGHDRSPLFLNFEDGKTWIGMMDSPQNMVDFLLNHKTTPMLNVKMERPLKAGWENKK